jgi:gamma-glutamyl hercynylcysteine S-oxide synthase
MSVKLENEPGSARKSAAKRWFGWRAPAEPAARPTNPVEPQGAGPTPEGETVGRFIDELVAQGRYTFALLQSAVDHVSEADAAPAWKALEREMALVPFGQVQIVRTNGALEMADVPAFLLDRFAVTNQQFERFVAAGCYDCLELWPREVFSSLMQFTDRAGRPGPAGWSNGTYPRNKAKHPVVGICWHEAAAYARWIGKRLPHAEEWQKAGGWPEHLAGGTCTRYPWGDLFDPTRANIWHSALAGTAAVDDFAAGDTPNGIHQMSGNVWEWLDDPLDAIPCREDESFRPQQPMRRVIGGAFDTYMLTEATCHFVTGQAELERRDNVGFRCALSADRLRDPFTNS